MNNRLVDSAEARIDAVSGAALYGKGIFTTIAIYNRKPHLWEKHWRRLTADVAKLGMQFGNVTEGSVYDDINEVAARNEVVNGRARVTLFDESPTAVWEVDGTRKTSLLIMTAEFRPAPGEVCLGISPIRVNSTSPVAGVKSCNYLENLMSLEEAKRREFQEAIRLNERGEVTSACMANVFWVKDERLFTPSLKTGCLAGTTREFVMENLDCEDVAAYLDELLEAEAIFLTSAGLGVVRVAEFDGRELAGEEHHILQLVAR